MAKLVLKQSGKAHGPLVDFDDLVSRKRLVVAQNRPNLGLRGKYLLYMGTFDR